MTTEETFIRRTFAGRERKFGLRLGEVSALERACNAGIGMIMLRLSSHQFYLADIRETIRLGLEGGGATEPEATGLIERYCDNQPLAQHLTLAAEILAAFVNGLPKDQPEKQTAEGGEDPATSPPTIKPAA